MPSPFPGMDPYLEGPLWPDVHHELVSAVRRQLVRRLGPGYVARVATRTVTDDQPEEDIGIIYPDVGVSRDRGAEGGDDPAAAAITPAALTLRSPLPARLRVVRVEVRSADTNRLVTAIEILSPVNKRGSGLREHRRKRERLRSARVHLLEIDLLRRGERVVPGRRLRPASCDSVTTASRHCSAVAAR